MTPVRAAGFDIGPEIGRGGFGVVYRARQVDLARTVALKVLDGGALSPVERRRFEHECRIVGSLPPHPAIVTVHHAGVTADGVPFLAMAHLPGGTLADRSPMPPEETARVGAVLADALAVAHAGGVVHRDVKPSNVLFTAEDEPVLVDFGIASLVGEGPTSTGSIALSLAYASPETLDESEIGPPTDIYALGATLFAALTGRAPFSVPGDNSVTRVAMRIAREPVEDLRPRGVPDGLCRVIETAMAKRPDHRFPTMVAMRDALEAVRDGDEDSLDALLAAGGPGAVAPRPPRPPRPPRRSGAAPAARRRRAAFVAAAAVVLGGGGYAAYALSGGSTGGHPAADQPSEIVAPSRGQAAEPVAQTRSGPGSTSQGSDPDAGRPAAPGSPAARSAPGARAQVVGAGRSGVATTAAHAPGTHPPVTKSNPPPPTRSKPPPAPRRATLKGVRRCDITVKIGTTVALPKRCSGWRGDWSPGSDTATRRVVWLAAGVASTNGNAKVHSSGYNLAKNTWTVSASKATTVHFYYRIRASYENAGKWRSAGRSTKRDWILVHFVAK